MRLSVEILDHIFSFLVLHSETLVACSKDPILSPMIERHLYYHIVVQIDGIPDPDYAFDPDHLSNLISEKPRILYHVRILQVGLNLVGEQEENHAIKQQLDNFSKLLLMFPVLECIMLIPSERCAWYWSDVFQDALEDRLNLPTLTEVHLAGGRNFPSSLLDNCKNITTLSLLTVESFEVDTGQVSDPTLPRLKSLALSACSISSTLRAWLLRHTSGLESFRCANFPKEILPEFLEGCSRTLSRLEMFLAGIQCSSQYIFRTGEIEIKHFPELSMIPQNLQQLTIHAGAYMANNDDQTPAICMSSLPAAAEAIKSFIPSLRHLILDINIELSVFSDFSRIDFSPLAVLDAASRSTPRIDLYLHTGISPAALTRAQFISLLGDYEGIMKSIEEGTLVIHSEVTAPHCP